MNHCYHDVQTSTTVPQGKCTLSPSLPDENRLIELTQPIEPVCCVLIFVHAILPPAFISVLLFLTLVIFVLFQFIPILVQWRHIVGNKLR